MKIIKKLKNLNGKQRKIGYFFCIILMLILFGYLHPYYLFIALSLQVLIVISYENHLILKNKLKISGARKK